ncbi:hypothetical protein [Streptomyces jeddahensis]|uniref:hypothetical protein n=1 Tax=Streptomyces jeddahensis TaxID=1716141 RepID=UPI000B33379D|nr:hypothetical protein [Streptomyces jeddahensis]
MASTTRRRSSAADRRAALEKRILSVIEECLRGGVTYTELSVEDRTVRGDLPLDLLSVLP